MATWDVTPPRRQPPPCEGQSSPDRVAPGNAGHLDCDGREGFGLISGQTGQTVREETVKRHREIDPLPLSPGVHLSLATVPLQGEGNIRHIQHPGLIYRCISARSPFGEIVNAEEGRLGSTKTSLPPHVVPAAIRFPEPDPGGRGGRGRGYARYPRALL